MYPGQNISKETNQFLKETPDDILGAVFLVYRDTTPLLAHFPMVEPSYLPIKGYIVCQIWHQCSQEGENASNIGFI